MKAMIEKIEVAVIGLTLIVGGVAGTAWMLREIHSSLLACAAFAPSVPLI